MLKTYHSGELRRLSRLIRHSGQFQLVIAEHNFPEYLEAVHHVVREKEPRAYLWTVPDALATADLFPTLTQLAEKHPVIQVQGFGPWWRKRGISVLHTLNYARERLAAELSILLILGLNRNELELFAREAPDIWAWRSAVLDFTLHLESPSPLLPFSRPEHAFQLPREDKKARLDELGDYLDTNHAQPHHAALWIEKANLYLAQGEMDNAERAAQQARKIAQEFDDIHSDVAAQGQIADILHARGQLDEAFASAKTSSYRSMSNWVMCVQRPSRRGISLTCCAPGDNSMRLFASTKTRNYRSMSNWVMCVQRPSRRGISLTFFTPGENLMRLFASAKTRSYRSMSNWVMCVQRPSRRGKSLTFCTPGDNLMRPFASAKTRSYRSMSNWVMCV